MFSNNNKKAFTFIELMVTISLLVTVLTISSISYRRSAKRSEIIAVAQQMAMDIRSMESFAANGQTPTDQKRGDASANIWGIHVNKNENSSYVLFSASNIGAKVYYHNDINYKDYKNVKFSSGLTIDELGCEDAAGNKTVKNSLNIRFIPPDPTVYIVDNNNPNSPCDIAYIRLKDDFNNSYKDVYINRFGLVDVVR